MKKLISFLLVITGTACGSGPEIQQSNYYKPYWPAPVYITHCRFWVQYQCGYTVYGCDNGITFNCLSQEMALRLLSN